MLLDVRRDRDRLAVFQAPKPGLLQPGQELADGVIICDTGILVADWNREEFKKALGGIRSDIGDNGRHLERIQLWRRSRQEFLHHLGNVCAIAIPFHLQDPLLNGLLTGSRTTSRIPLPDLNRVWRE
jgi:hypothetical protein